MFENLSLFALILKGGVAVLVLALFSTVSIAVMLQKWWAYRNFTRGLRSSFQALNGALREKGVDAAADAARGPSTPLTRVFLAGYAKRALGREEVMYAMELAGRDEIARLERLLGVLGTIGSTAPFVGLFGTVVGIIRAFSDLAAAHGASPAAVADGIAEALVATAAGLFVAVPAVMAYNYFARSTGARALELERYAAEFTHALTEGR